ncbi:60S ribosomal protein L21 [Thelohanellus kitauei]|uniref:60S ribosomal protein L21 n=1 Tax=Thelohanellus kitauei TaxID=669202 RepID=A0A0C2NCI5_THEKT|nr:60S ribosomal protein L21 [Thelohanellus kitauei]
MTNSKGYRRNTRHVFSRPHKKHGVEHLSTYMYVYKRGQFVDLKGHGAFHKGMPHKYFHGKTGRIFDITKRAVGVVVNKRVKGRIMQKKMHVRIEHVKPSQCNKDHLLRIEKRKELMRTAKKGVKLPSVKRVPEGPKGAHFVKYNTDQIVELRPLRFTQMF